MSILSDLWPSSTALENITYLLPAAFQYAELIDDSDSLNVVSASPITYHVEGVQGNRVFKLQFKDIAFTEEQVQGLTPLSTCNTM